MEGVGLICMMPCHIVSGVSHQAQCAPMYIPASTCVAEYVSLILASRNMSVYMPRMFEPKSDSTVSHHRLRLALPIRLAYESSVRLPPHPSGSRSDTLLDRG